MKHPTLLAVLAIPACVYNQPAPPAQEVFSRTIEAPIEVVWKRAADNLQARGFPLALANKELGAITTGKKMVSLTSAQVDCGNIFGLPYAGDRRTTFMASLAAKVVAEGAGSTVTLSADIDGNFLSHAGAQPQRLNCRSLGALEKEILGSL